MFSSFQLISPSCCSISLLSFFSLSCWSCIWYCDVFSHHSCFSQRTGTYVLSLIKVGFYSPPTEVMNSYLHLTRMKHKPLAGLRGFLGWKMIDRWCTLHVSNQPAPRTLWMLTAVIEECSMALYLGSWPWQKWVTHCGLSGLLDQTCSFTVESSSKMCSFVSVCLVH